MVNQGNDTFENLPKYAEEQNGLLLETQNVSNLQNRLIMLFQEKSPENPKVELTSTRGGESEPKDYEFALSHAQPNDKGLWYREVFKEKLLSNEQQEEFISILRDAIKTNDEEFIRSVVKTAFSFFWTKMGTGLTNEEIEEVVNSLDSFKNPLIVPVEKIGNTGIYLINETTGPTDAFKDLALQQVTTMISVITKRKNTNSVIKALEDKNNGITYNFETVNQKEELVKYKNGTKSIEQGNRPKISIVITQTSTSGDTGPAGGAGIEGRDFVANIIGFPAFEATQGQIGQMTNLKGNVVAIAFEEAFTIIQEEMKKCNNNEFKEKLQKSLEDKFKELRKQYGFDIDVSSGSFNSVNIGRIDGQAIYHSITNMVAKAQNPEITGNIIKSTPSGNFGHQKGVLQANEMVGGVDEIITSFNENDAIYNLLKNGKYKKALSEISSPSVSMIIRYGSNVERLLRKITSPERCAELMNIFENESSGITLSPSEHQKITDLGLKAYRVETAEELLTIRNVWLNHNRLICPHTANAYFAAKQFNKENPLNKKSILVSETASPWKFLAATAVALTYSDEKELAIRYEELRVIENTPEGKTILLNMIKDAYTANGKIFDENVIPENLREIYIKGVDMGKVCHDAKEFGDLTITFVEKIGDIFTQQVEGLINENK